MTADQSCDGLHSPAIPDETTPGFCWRAAYSEMRHRYLAVANDFARLKAEHDNHLKDHDDEHERWRNGNEILAAAFQGPCAGLLRPGLDLVKHGLPALVAEIDRLRFPCEKSNPHMSHRIVIEGNGTGAWQVKTHNSQSPVVAVPFGGHREDILAYVNSRMHVADGDGDEAADVSKVIAASSQANGRPSRDEQIYSLAATLSSVPCERSLEATVREQLEDYNWTCTVKVGPRHE